MEAGMTYEDERHEDTIHAAVTILTGLGCTKLVMTVAGHEYVYPEHFNRKVYFPPDGITDQQTEDIFRDLAIHMGANGAANQLARIFPDTLNLREVLGISPIRFNGTPPPSVIPQKLPVSHRRRVNKGAGRNTELSNHLSNLLGDYGSILCEGKYEVCLPKGATEQRCRENITSFMRRRWGITRSVLDPAMGQDNPRMFVIVRGNHQPI
jgi:hypothetical protein